MSARLLSALAVMTLLAAAATTPAASSASRLDTATTVERGVVQSTGWGALSLKELDGTVVYLSISPKAKVSINKHPAVLEMIRPGFVAALSHRGKQPAYLVQAWGKAPKADWGVIQRLDSDLITLNLSGQFGLAEADSLLAIRLDFLTEVRKGRQLMSLADLHPGYSVKVVHSTEPTAPATRIYILGRFNPHIG